jgi:hypothetical protein
MPRSLLSLFFLLGVHFLQAQNDTIRMGPDKIDLGYTGLPKQIDSLLAENIHFHFTRSSDGKDIRMHGPGAVFTSNTFHGQHWTAADSSEELTMKVRGRRHLNGALSFQVTVKALQDLELKEITMHIPLRPDSNFTWKKDTSRKDTIMVVIATRNMLPGYVRLGYVLLGKEWANEGKGGITVGIKGRSLLANNYSGAHSMKKGDRLEYDFNLFVPQASKP